MSTKRTSTLEHLREDLEDIVSFTAGMDCEAFAADIKTRKAVSMSLINIGELARQLDDEIKQEHPEIPWRSITGMRNITAHGYHQLNVNTIWETITMDIHPLLAFVQKELSQQK